MKDMESQKLERGVTAALSNSISSSNDQEEHNSVEDAVLEGPLTREPIFYRWSQFTVILHKLIQKFVVSLARHAAQRPWIYTIGISFLACACVSIGFATNFNIQVEYQIVYAPQNSLPKRHLDWINDKADFPKSGRGFSLLIHDRGNNVLDNCKDGVRQVFEALNVLRTTPGYQEMCAKSRHKYQYPNGTKETMCPILGVTRFWQFNETLFEQEVQTNKDAIRTLSAYIYPDGVPVDESYILGKYEYSHEINDDWNGPSLTNWSLAEQNNTLTRVESFMSSILFPSVDAASDVERRAIQRLLDLRQRWKDDLARELESGVDNTTMQLEVIGQDSYAWEFERAIYSDIWLIFLVGVIMVGFTCMVFFKRHKVESRSLLGVFSVFTIAMSIFMGHGILFICGLPFTNPNMMLPFIIFGVGLDDTFIIMGAYFRTDPSKDIVKRIEETMEEVGLSITLTTITTMVAFALGFESSVPSIRWVCIYAFLSIGIDFVFQITLFVAFVVLDERRVKANRRDCVFCIKAEKKGEENDNGEPHEEGDERHVAKTKPMEIASLCMRWYADLLLSPVFRAVIVVTFVGYFGLCLYRTTLLDQQFKSEDFMPRDSYVTGYIKASRDYGQEMISVGIYFRDVNQSDKAIQQQMRNYIDDLYGLSQVTEYPPFCWVRDFEKFKGNLDLGFNVSSLTFNEQLNLAMQDPRVKELYGDDIVRDQRGNITASRCWLYVKNVNFNDVQEQVNLLLDQRAVTAKEPVNQGKHNWPFFTLNELYFLWEFYAITANQLTFSTVTGVVAVTVVSFLLMPHWTATVFVLPMIVILYLDLLGTLQIAGLHINVVTYICLVISIGLLVDFIMHVLLRYYESPCKTRGEKVKDTVETMGVSILVGGLSTFLAVIPLAFSTSKVIATVFTAFFGMITLGLAHGLVFLPVILSIFGPTHSVSLHSHLASKQTEPSVSPTDSLNDSADEATEQVEIIESQS